MIRGLMTIQELREEYLEPGITVDLKGRCKPFGRTLLPMPIEIALARAEMPTASHIAKHCDVCKSTIELELAKVGEWVVLRWHDLQMQRSGHAPLFD
jgi:hypothetical protein